MIGLCARTEHTSKSEMAPSASFHPSPTADLTTNLGRYCSNVLCAMEDWTLGTQERVTLSNRSFIITCRCHEREEVRWTNVCTWAAHFSCSELSVTDLTHSKAT